ncbi:MAG: hypothetical protein EBU97_04535 [Rhodobacteraceae bacterium]|nr:hypothetical protein [Paracoccaceae bacterium]
MEIGFSAEKAAFVITARKCVITRALLIAAGRGEVIRLPLRPLWRAGRRRIDFLPEIRPCLNFAQQNGADRQFGRAMIKT